MRKTILILVILLALLLASQVRTGETPQLFTRIGEWLDINIFTISTRAKQEKKLELASGWALKLSVLAMQSGSKIEDMKTALQQYQNYLRQAEDMAEKIIFLDGKEIGLAENFESISRYQESLFADLLFAADERTIGIIYEALSTSMIENEKIFKFMVERYQSTDEDIEKYRRIVEAHIAQVKQELGPLDAKSEQIAAHLEEAQKFLKAGLNIQAYEQVKKAKILRQSLD